MSARHVDFDAIWVQMEAARGPVEAPTAVIQGEMVTLPADCPVAVVLLAERLRDPDQRDQVRITELVRVLNTVVGEEVVERWLADGISPVQLVALLLSLPAFWRPIPAAEEQEPADVC